MGRMKRVRILLLLSGAALVLLVVYQMSLSKSQYKTLYPGEADVATLRGLDPVNCSTGCQQDSYIHSSSSNTSTVNTRPTNQNSPEPHHLVMHLKPKQPMNHLKLPGDLTQMKTSSDYSAFLPQQEISHEPVAPALFNSSLPRTVLLLSYQKSGSSFMGEYLFSYRPGIFYLYEPLDALYNAMYGVRPGYTVPADITMHPNGSLRVVPEEEGDAVSGVMHAILSCDVHTLPTAMFRHGYSLTTYPGVPSLEDYKVCSKSYTSAPPCSSSLWRFCGQRFVEPDKLHNLNICKKRLWNREKNVVPDIWIKSFDKYESCNEKNIQQIRDCVPKMQSACQSSPLRAIKTVRATMDEVEPLLKADPNFRLIHLYRDPRAVYRSRRTERTYMSLYELSRKPFFMLCQTLLHDYKKRRELEEKYPGRIKAIVYDHFMLNSEKYRQDVYDFLDLPLELRQQSLPNEKNPSSLPSSKWQTELTAAEVKMIQTNCQQFADTIGAKW